MNTFDLNIDSYELQELESLLKLVIPYNLTDVVQNERMIVDIISKDVNVSTDKKNEMIQFMKLAKDRLVTYLKRQLDKTIQNEQLLPEEEYVIQNDVGKVVNQTSTITGGGGNSFVQNKETVSFNDVLDKDKYLNPVESYPTHIARSDLNTLKRKTITQSVVINTTFREDYYNTTSTNFSMFLPYQFKNILSMRLSSLQLPNVLYCFSTSKKNNTIYIEETEGVFAKGTVTLADGNYTLSEVIVELTNAINTQLSSGNRFSVTANPYTHQITISNTSSIFKIESGTGDKSKIIVDTMSWILGFRKEVLEGEKSYTASSIYNPNSSDNIFFVLNDYNKSQSQNIIGMFAKSYISDNILAMIPLTSDSFTVCFNSGNDLLEKKRTYFGPVNIQRIRVELRDKYGEFLDLQGMDYSFSLDLEVGYDW